MMLESTALDILKTSRAVARRARELVEADFGNAVAGLTTAAASYKVITDDWGWIDDPGDDEDEEDE